MLKKKRKTRRILQISKKEEPLEQQIKELKKYITKKVSNG